MTVPGIFKSEVAIKVLIAVLLLLQAAISFQGFDLCDEGMSLTFYQQFFNDPKSVEYNFVYWLSGLIGGLWYQINPQGGILWFRVLAIIVNTATLLIGLKLLGRYLDRFYALIGLAMVLFANDYGYIIFYHNTLTALIAVSAIYFLVEGLIQNKSLYIVLAGGLCAINVATRLPNIAFFIIVTSIPFYNGLNKAYLVKSIRQISVFFGGSLIGFLVVFSLLILLGQLDVMKSALEGIATSGGTATSNHSISFLLKQYLLSYKLALKTLVVTVASIPIAVSFFYLIRQSRFLIYCLVIVAIIGLAILYDFKNINFLYALSILGCICLLISPAKPEIRLLALCALCAAIFLPMGSDGGIRNSGYMSIWLSVPIFFVYAKSVHILRNPISNYISFYNDKQHFVALKYWLLVVVSAFFIRKAYNISQGAYFDFGSRFKKTAHIDNRLADNILTTPRRAKITNDILLKLQDYLQPNDHLLAYDKLPTIHFLTETRPYMYIPWVWVYDENSFDIKLREAERTIEALPVVLQQKFETIGEFSMPLDDYMDASKENTYRFNQGRTKSMNDFLKRNNYEIVWSNKYFNILKPKLNKIEAL